MIGGGIIWSNASQQVRDFVDKTGIPVTSTLMGLGAMPSDHPLFLGMPGMHGTVYANYSLMDADLILAIGCRFDDRVTGKLSTFAPNAKIVHADIDPSSIGKNVTTHLPIVGDAKNVLEQLTEQMKALPIEKWVKQIRQWKEEYPLTYLKKEKEIKPQEVLELINKLTKDIKTVFTTEVGQNQMWAAQFLKLDRPRQFLTSGGLGTMGYGFPATLGAQAAAPDAMVIGIAGDGSFQMNLQELATVKNYNLPIKVVILNNSFLGMVRQWQELFYDKRYAGTCLSRDADCPPQCTGKECMKYWPDFVKLADAYGIPGYYVDDPAKLEATLKEALIDNKGPALLDIRISKEENVMPMVPAGHAINNIIQKYE
jgi:acetolactate synthase-1/2/3 large subunit